MSTSDNISYESEVFSMSLSKGQVVYAFQFTPEALINSFKNESMDFAISTEPPTAKIKELLRKYHSVFMIKDGNTPRITVFSRGENVGA